MITVGIPTETKIGEGRVALVPDDVDTLLNHTPELKNLEIYIQSGAGQKSGYSDSMYSSVGAKVVRYAEELYANSKYIVKVKEPIESDKKYLNSSHILLSYLHLAAEPDLVTFLTKNKVESYALEHIEVHGMYVALNPMSEIAGKLSVQKAAHYLYSSTGGKGILLSGIPGVKRCHVVVLGAGTAGRAAAKLAAEMGAKVSIFDINPLALQKAELVHNRIEPVFMSNSALKEYVKTCDVLIGAVYIPGKSAPKLVTREMVKSMEPSSVIVDISADQGGCVETMRPTTHENPFFVDEGVIHVGIPNLPGTVPQTSSRILSGTIVKYVKDLILAKTNETIMQDYLRLSLCTQAGTLHRT